METKVKKDKRWFEFRKAGIGSSEAPVIMGASPWSTPKQLWLERTGRKEREASNWAMERGLRMEPAARAWYENTMGIEMTAKQMVHPLVNYIRASFDGHNGFLKRALEIKCPGKEDHALATQGKIPKKYIWQLVHLALVADVENVDYLSFNGEDGVIVPFRRDRELEKQLFPKLVEFWECIQNDVPPPEEKKTGIFKVRRSR